MKELVRADLPLDLWMAVNELIRGRTNATGSVTLDANASSTTLTDSRIMPTSVLFLSPETATAASESPYVDTYSTGTCVIHHANTADTDKTFRFVILTGGEG